MSLPVKKVREIVFLLLYSLDLGTDDENGLIELVMKQLSVTRKAVKQALVLASTILKEKNVLDPLITRVSQSYAFGRIQTVERNILRLSIYELLKDKAIPSKVAIAEGVRLSRKFGTPESSSFINAILDHIYKEFLEKEEKLDESSPPKDDSLSS